MKIRTKIRTNALQGRALNWAVAQARIKGAFEFYAVTNWNPSTDWAQGGPIIEREWITLTPWPNESDEDMRWEASQFEAREVVSAFGPTPLIAAMRCFVASSLGDEVDVPDALIEVAA